MDIGRLTQVIKEFFALEFDESSTVLLHLKSFKIKKIPKKNLFSRPLCFFYTKILKTYAGFDKAADLLAGALRFNVMDMISTIQRLFTASKDPEGVANQAIALFDEAEENLKSLILDLKKASSTARDLFIHRLLVLEELIKKEKSRKLLPLLSYLRLQKAWNEKVQQKSQDIFSKDLTEQVSFLKSAGTALADLVEEKKTIGLWGDFLDIEGKSTLFQEMAEKIIRSSLNDDKFKLFKAYITLLKNPKEPTLFLGILRESFADSLPEGEDSMTRLHLKRGELEKKAFLLKLKWEEGNGHLESIRKELTALREEREVQIPKIEIEMPGTFDKVLKEKFVNLIKTLAKIACIQGPKERQNNKEIREELFDLGLITPTIQELSNPAALFADPNLLKTGEEVHLAITSEIAGLRRDLIDISQSIEGYSDRLKNEKELETIENTLKMHHEKTAPFVSQLIEKKGPRRRLFEEYTPLQKKPEENDAVIRFERSKEFITSLAKKLNIEASPLNLTEEDLESAFFSLASPYMTEGAQGKLPIELALLRSEILRAEECLQEMRASPLLGLAREKERLRSLMKSFEGALEPVNEVMRFLKECKSQESRKSRLQLLTHKKKLSEERLEKIEKELNEAEKDLYVIEGVEAVFFITAKGHPNYL